jgi:hypothetical protein
MVMLLDGLGRRNLTNFDCPSYRFAAIGSVFHPRHGMTGHA